jgi:hypothetical protein
LVFGLLFGGVSGVILARASNSAIKRANELEAELKQTRDELAAFKGQVTQHFSKTAELVSSLTANYRSVYSHLAEGAQRFSNSDALKLETINTADPLLSSDAKSNETNTEQGWFESSSQDADEEGTEHDDRFH